MNQKKSLRGRALDLLARREMSRTELAQKLARHAESQDELDNLLEEFAQKNWQSDERFTQNFIELRGQKYGYRRITEELKQKGISTEDLSQFKPDKETELETALRVLCKKFKMLPASPQEEQKCIRFLAYRGFDFDTINRALHLRKQQEKE